MGPKTQQVGYLRSSQLENACANVCGLDWKELAGSLNHNPAKPAPRNLLPPRRASFSTARAQLWTHAPGVGPFWLEEEEGRIGRNAAAGAGAVAVWGGKRGFGSGIRSVGRGWAGCGWWMWVLLTESPFVREQRGWRLGEGVHADGGKVDRSSTL